MTEIVTAELAGSPQAAAGETAGVSVPAQWREMAAVVLAVVVCDVTLYRGQGWAGYAALFLAAPALLLLGAPAPRRSASVGLVAAMLGLTSVRMLWLGSALTVTAGFALIVALAMTLAGRTPAVLGVLAYGLQTVVAGARGLGHYLALVARSRPRLPRRVWLNVGIPVAVLAVFGTLFVLANPDVVQWLVDGVARLWRTLCESLDQFVPTGAEVLVWGAAAWATSGLLRPVLAGPRSERSSPPSRDPEEAALPTVESAMYAAIRNTLAAVSVLFAVYLGFEFQTLWFRAFPPGFHYSGYAHEGAAWLTVALALATVVLSLAFRGRVFQDPRLPNLRRLAWVWSAENLLLALAVYHRLWIYIGFNGMTRMRTVAVFGISAVVVGFLLVIWKIAHRRDFAWLLQRHLWTVAIAAYVFTLTPVDTLVYRYNVRRILAGDPAPAVQISVHPISAEGVLVLPPLTQSDDPIIREGLRALLAERAIQAEATAQRRAQQGWTAVQFADRLLLDRLRAVRSEWQEYRDPSRRAAALEQFHRYVYQWY